MKLGGLCWIFKRFAISLIHRYSGNSWRDAAALAIASETLRVKFDETLDISIVLNKEKNKGEGLSRGFAQLPNGTGRKIKVAVFAATDKAKEAKDAGADIVGNEDLIKDVKDGKIRDNEVWLFILKGRKVRDNIESHRWEI